MSSASSMIPSIAGSQCPLLRCHALVVNGCCTSFMLLNSQFMFTVMVPGYRLFPKMRVAARLQERYMRNNSEQERIDARRNSRLCRGDQAVSAAAKEASLTLMLPRDAWPN